MVVLIFDVWQVQIFQEKGIAAAPKNKMQYAQITESRTSRIVAQDPPIHGHLCYEVFYFTNRLFETLLDKYTPECPGRSVVSHNKNTMDGDVYLYFIICFLYLYFKFDQL